MTAIFMRASQLHKLSMRSEAGGDFVHSYEKFGTTNIFPECQHSCKFPFCSRFMNESHCLYFILVMINHMLFSQNPSKPLLLHNFFSCYFNYLQDTGLDRAGKGSCWLRLWGAVLMWCTITTWNPWRESDPRGGGCLGRDNKNCHWTVKTN